MKRLVGVAMAGVAVAAVAAWLLGIPASDAVELIAISFGVALACWAVGAGAIIWLSERWLSPTAALRLSALAVAITPAVSLAVGALFASRAMFVSTHDLQVLVVVVCGAGAVGVAATLRVAHEIERRREEARASSERQAAVDQSRRELVAWVSHDLRTPLSGIRLMAEALNDGMVEDAEHVDQYHQRIQAEAQRMTKLVDDLFELSRLQLDAVVLTLERVSLGDLVSDALASAQLSADARGVTLRGNVVGFPSEVEASSRELLRVLQNLLDNAIRHTPRGGSVVVELSDHGSDQPVEQGAWQCLSVTDQCGGIAPHDISRVFELAYRGDEARSPQDGGGGLGLAIARGLVDAHHGKIDVVNTEDGCRFTVRLPVSPARSGGEGPA